MKKNAANYFSAIAGLILLIIGLISLKVIDNPQGVMLTLPYLCVGIGCGIFGGGMGNILGERAFKKHPELKKQKEIEEKDERNVSIANQSKARGICLWCHNVFFCIDECGIKGYTSLDLCVFVCNRLRCFLPV